MKLLANNWLDSKRIEAKEARNSRIEMLRESLELNGLYLEKTKEGQTLVVIPVAKSYTSIYNKDKSASPYLLLTLTGENTVYKGNIVLYNPDNRNAGLARNTFAKIVDEEQVEANARFTFLGIFDRYLYTSGYKNGKKESFAEIRPRRDAATAARLNCIEWYIETTYYNPDGSIAYVTEDVIAVTCDGDCTPVDPGCIETGDGWDPSSGGGGGGGTGSGDNPDYEYAVAKDKEWNVATNPHPGQNGIGEIKSYERIKGKRSSSQPQGGYFTSINHYWSICNFCSGQSNVWTESSNSVSASGQTASSTVSGTLQYYGTQYTYTNITKVWNFSEIFP